MQCDWLHKVQTCAMSPSGTIYSSWFTQLESAVLLLVNLLLPALLLPIDWDSVSNIYCRHINIKCSYFVLSNYVYGGIIRWLTSVSVLIICLWNQKVLAMLAAARIKLNYNPKTNYKDIFIFQFPLNYNLKTIYGCRAG